MASNPVDPTSGSSTLLQGAGSPSRVLMAFAVMVWAWNIYCVLG